MEDYKEKFRERFRHLGAYQKKQEQKEREAEALRRCKNPQGTCEECGVPLVTQGNCSYCPVCGDGDCSL